MQVTVTVSPNEQGADLLRRIASVIASAEAGTEMRVDEGDGPRSVKIETNKEPRKRRTKAEMEAAKQGATAKDEDSAEDMSGEIEVEEIADVDLGLGDDEPAAKAPKKISKEKDLIPAFQAYAVKHSKSEAGQILVRFGVRSVHDLPESKYADVLKTLQA